MKKAGRRVWVWILSGLALILGVACHSHRAPSCLYGPPEELYGPPSTEKLYGPPVTEMEMDSVSEPDATPLP